MLVWPSGQRRVSVVPRRGSPGGRGDVRAAGRADPRAADRFEGLVEHSWKQLHREYPSVEAEAHAALDVPADVGDDVDLLTRRRLSAHRLRAPVSVIFVNRAQDREYDDHDPDGRRGGERHREQAASADEAPQRRRAVQLAELLMR